MTCRFVALAAAALLFIAAIQASGPAEAADLPPLKLSDSNSVAECATPGRLMAFLKARHGALDAKYEAVATEYMRHGEGMGLRWDYAFFQMLLETGFLTYTGDVQPEQNNFAGLGATGGGVRGESFKDVSTGVRAHLEHLLMYSGERIERPIAERTRNIQEWGVLASWQKTIKGPMTFAQLARQWAPGNRRYASDIKAIADRFFAGVCNEPDPRPELLAQARGTVPLDKEIAKGSAPPTVNRPQGQTAEAAPRVVKGSLTDGAMAAAAGGAPAPPKASTATGSVPATEPSATGPQFTVLNAPPPGSLPEASPSATAVETASVAGAAATGASTAAQKEAERCRVWTASYGGTKAILIKAIAEQTINYTVLDVNDGAERREADAYIRAYAKGGERMGEFPSQAQALDKAFELCPEG